MNAFLKQYWAKGVALIVVVALLLAGSSYLRGNFHAGECVQALDGYVWHINNYSFGKYTVMGWQSNAWGNEAVMEKSALERANSAREFSGLRFLCRMCPL